MLSLRITRELVPFLGLQVVTGGCKPTSERGVDSRKLSLRGALYARPNPISGTKDTLTR